MRAVSSDTFQTQIEELLAEYKALKARLTRQGGGVPTEEIMRFITRARAAIDRIARPGSAYFVQSEKIMEDAPYSSAAVAPLAGVLGSLEADLKAGYLESFSQLLRGELFGDFLEMADHLVGEGYKDAAAVVGGSALEAHLRQLCQANEIDVVTDEGRARKAESLNADLAKAQVYSLVDQKSVTAWLGLRNDAAHGHYDRYEVGQVRLLISGVRDFIVRNP